MAVEQLGGSAYTTDREEARQLVEASWDETMDRIVGRSREQPRTLAGMVGKGTGQRLVGGPVRLAD